MDVKKLKTADVWRERVVAQQVSGQSIRAWYKELGSHEHAFYWWRSRLGLLPRLVIQPHRRRQAAGLRFVEVVVASRTAHRIDRAPPRRRRPRR